MTNETWKIIEDYPNYMVSNKGNIKNCKRGNTLKPNVNRWGYTYVVLCGNGTKKTLTVHRLVAKAFIPNPNNLPQVHHINGIKTYNYQENLAWVTNTENCEHELTEEFTMIHPDNGTITFRNLRRFCREYNLTRSSVRKVIDKVRNHHKGWRLI